MGSESAMRSYITNSLKVLDAQPVENVAWPGYPDIDFIGGRIEVKQVDEPAGEDTPVRVPHYTDRQRAWARIRHARGGCVLVAIRVGRRWILIEGVTAANILGNVPLHTLIEHSWCWWPGRPGKRELLAYVRSYIEARRREIDAGRRPDAGREAVPVAPASTSEDEGRGGRVRSQ